MANPHGTAWTAPGEGATAYELMQAAIRSGRMGSDVMHLATHPGRETARTNLLLTGRPLVAYDLERIASCEVTR